MNDERRIDTLLYPINDTLIYNGTINKPGTFQIATDSSASQYVWIDSHPTSCTLTEERTKMGNTYFKINNLQGSEDSKLLFQMTQPRVILSAFYPASLNKEQRDSISNASRFKQYAFYYNIIDSIFNIRPNSPIIPFYIRLYQRTLGPDTVALFYKRLNNELQNSEQGLKIKEFLDQCVLLKIGTIIENFSMRNQKGKKQSLHRVSAKYILLDFWASWCLPCRGENPNLVNLYKKYHDKGFEIIGISLDENKKDWLQAIEKDKLEWLHVSELKGWENSIAEKYKISAVPFTILLDSNYKVVAVNLSAGQLETLFNELY
jgi:thiol-disulfide isomerase/thioredoxin